MWEVSRKERIRFANEARIRHRDSTNYLKDDKKVCASKKKEEVL